ncbi:MAG: segregation/condensation protein A [Xenococcaceae cyanobacterium MO_188.B32]|nr:segregation/condensation protein A [Xenococcaceae cyanobacterium MO_188.B32]
MAIVSAQSAIADLINLAEQGEIDPWDVPVIEMIDRFLSELGLIGENISAQKNTNLPQSGQAFVWASMLVLLKADTLEMLRQEDYNEESNEFIDEEILIEESNRHSLPLHLERHLRRRTSTAVLGKRRVTLQELIEQIEHIAAEIEASATNSRPKKSSRSRKEAIRAITQLAHNENLSELAIQLESFLYSDLPQLAPQQDYIDWEELLQWWINKNNSNEQVAIDNTNHSSVSERAGVFWALLLLSAQSKVELCQQEFYQDLTIRPLNLG